MNLTKITPWAGVLGSVLLWTGPLQAQEPPKVGTPRSLPLLQTRARPPLSSENLHLGMTETDFFAYARDHNWAAVTSKFVDIHGLHRLQPGGEGLYTLNSELVYAKGFVADVYFSDRRLVGIRLLPDTRDRPLNLPSLFRLAQAWFPDQMLSVIYQVLPDDPQRIVVDSLIGTIPDVFRRELGRASLPFCRAVVFSRAIAPKPLTTCPHHRLSSVFFDNLGASQSS